MSDAPSVLNGRANEEPIRLMKTFLALDFMVGTADQAYASAAFGMAQQALAHARDTDQFIAFSKVGYRPGHPEVSPNNRVFSRLLGTNQLVGEGSRLVDALKPGVDEPVLDKKRFSAFSGSGLWTILRARGVTQITMCGLSTSGVVLSTALELIDADATLTVLSDACADPEPGLHDTVMGLLRGRCDVRTVADWVSGASA